MTIQPSEFHRLAQAAQDTNTPPENLQQLARQSQELARLVASNPSTPPQLLQELSGSKDAITRQNVAENPHTPTHVLWKLGVEFPTHVLNNPVFSLFLLEHLNLTTDIPGAVLKSLLNKELTRLVATNPMTPPELLEELANSQDRVTCRNITANPNTPTQVLLKLGEDFPGELLNNPTFSLLFLENPNLIDEMPRATLKQLLIHESVPIFFLEMVAKTNNNTEACCYVAIHPKTPIKALTELAAHKNERVRTSVAKNPQTPVDILEKLAQDTYWDVRIGVGENPHTPVKLLEQLAQDKGAPVIVSVAANPRLPAPVLAQLAQDPYYGVRISVAENPSTPLEALKKLAEDDLVSISNRAMKNIKKRQLN